MRMSNLDYYGRRPRRRSREVADDADLPLTERIRRLEKEMRAAAKRLEFEEAAALRDRMQGAAGAADLRRVGKRAANRARNAFFEARQGRRIIRRGRRVTRNAFFKAGRGRRVVRGDRRAARNAFFEARQDRRVVRSDRRRA